jgi:hypothetical protein
MPGFYKLKAGAHTEGEGQNLKNYHASDPTNNVVFSETNLAEEDPGKFEEVSQQQMERMRLLVPDRSRVYGEGRPPQPSTALQATISALLLEAIPAEQMEARADELQQMADALRQRAQQAQKVTSQAAEAMRATARAYERHEQPRAHLQAQASHESLKQETQAPEVKPPEPPRVPGQQDSEFFPGSVQPAGTSGPAPGQVPFDKLPPQQQEQRNREEAQRREQQARAEAEQARAKEVGEERQQAPQGQEGAQAQGQQEAPPAGQEDPAKGQQARSWFASLSPEQQRSEDGKLDNLTVEQLREVAEVEEIELPRYGRKDQLINLIRQARRGQG